MQDNQDMTPDEQPTPSQKYVPASLKVFQDMRSKLKENADGVDNETTHEDYRSAYEETELTQSKSVDENKKNSQDKSPEENEKRKTLKLPKKEDNSIEENADYKLAKERLYETNKYARTLNQDFLRKSDNVITKVKELMENGDLPEDTAKEIIGILKEDKVKKPDGFMDKEEETNSHPFKKFYDAADNTEIQNYVDYTGDNDYKNKLRAFEQLIQIEANQEELNDIYHTLEPLLKSPARLVTKIMEIGNNFLKDGFGEFIDSGSFRKYSERKENEILNKIKEIDKLKREIVQLKGHEDDKPSFGFERYASDYPTDHSDEENKKNSSASVKVFRDREAQFKAQQGSRK